MSSVTLTVGGRRQRLESLIAKRHTAFEYLKTFFNGDSFWMGAVYFSKLDIKKFISSAEYKDKCLSLFILGISLSKINDNLTAGSATSIYCFLQLFEEWEYHFGSPPLQAMKYLMAKNTSTLTPHSSFSNTDPDKIGIYKLHSEVVYEFLLTPHLPFDLSFLEVFSCLCDELTCFYEHFNAPEYSMNSFYFETIVKADALIQTHILDALAKDITVEANLNLKHDIDALRIGAGGPL